MKVMLNETQNNDVMEGKDYLVGVIRCLSKQPTQILEQLSSDCLNVLFASRVHLIYRMSIENGCSVAESVEKALNDRVICKLFIDTQINSARKEVEESMQISFKESKVFNASKAVS